MSEAEKIAACPTCKGEWPEVCSNAFHLPPDAEVYWPVGPQVVSDNTPTKRRLRVEDSGEVL
jgi:hypothetical protein